MAGDLLTLAGKAFNTPLMIDPAKAAVIAQTVAPKLLRASDVELVAPGIAPGPEHERRATERASIVGDEIHRTLRQRGGGYGVHRGIAVVPVIGTLVRRGAWIGQDSSGMTSYEGLSAQIRAAVEDPEVRAIALEIDSFGGEAAGVFKLMAEIRAARDVKPVRAFIADFALSAGYAIAASADRIAVPPFGQAGSIGVLTMHVDIEGQLEREGKRVTLIYSGARKVDGNPFEALPDRLREEIQRDNDVMWARFAEEVALGRRGAITTEGALRTEAAVFRGAAAAQAGLADEVAEAGAAFAAWADELEERTVVQVPAAGGAVRAVSAGAADMLAPMGQRAAHPAFGQLGTRAMPGQTGAGAPKTEEGDMPDDVKTPAGEARPEAAAPETGAVAQIEGAMDHDGADAEAAVRDERERASKIMAKAEKAGLPSSFASQLIAEGVGLEVAYERILDAKAERAEDGGEIRNAVTARVTGDGRDRTRAGVTEALLAKAGLDGGARNEFSSMTLREMARSVLSAQGVAIPAGGAMQLASAAFAPAMAGGMHSTSDFGNILADVASKAMLKGFDESPEVFDQFTSTGTMTDFKPHKRVGLDAFPALGKVEEGAEFTYGTMGDHGESAVLATYGKLFAITRQTIINDDLDAFTRVPMKMGRAARRTVGDLVFAVLTGNPNMSDGTALFHADHGNLAGSGASPSESTINAGITAMATQQDRSGNAYLNISPRFLVAPPKWRSAVLQALNSEYAPDDTDKAGSSKMSRAYNTVRDAATPLFDARITGDSWFLLADPAQFDTIEVGYLDGVATPFLDQQDGWSVDGTEFKVRIDACATPLAWEAMYKNPGS